MSFENYGAVRSPVFLADLYCVLIGVFYIGAPARTKLIITVLGESAVAILKPEIGFAVCAASPRFAGIDRSVLSTGLVPTRAEARNLRSRRVGNRAEVSGGRLGGPCVSYLESEHQ
jgi:hypothetical protein